MTVESIFLWLYWFCYVAMWYAHLADSVEKPRWLRMAKVSIDAAAILGMLLYLAQITRPGVGPAAWVVLAFVVAVTLANEAWWYQEVTRKPPRHPVPDRVKKAAAVFAWAFDFIVQVPCMVVLYRLATIVSTP